MKKTQRGGVRITNTFTQVTAIKHFIQNSKFQLFTTSGISGIQVLAALNTDIESPYRTIRTNIFNKEVRQILFKLFKVGNRRGYSGEHQITLIEDIDRETKIQIDIYKKSYQLQDTLLEPLCPCIVFAHYNPINESIKTQILQNITDGEGADIIETFLHGDVGFIAMELLEGYKTLDSLKNTPKYELYKLMALYELNKMHKIGYMHNDFHFQNVLIHETYNYFDTNSSGRALIIDFGAADKVDSEIASLDTLLRQEYGELPENLFEIFILFDKQHSAVQNTYISAFEIRVGKPIRDVISSFVMYTGGSMSSSIKHLGIVPKQHDWNLPPADTLDRIVKEFLAGGLQSNPTANQLFDDSVNSVHEMQKTDPNYLEKLVKAQGNGLIVSANPQKLKTRKSK